MPFPQCGFLTSGRRWVLHDCIAKVIYHRCYGEHASQPLVKTLLGLACLVCAGALSAANTAVDVAVIASLLDDASSCERCRNCVNPEQAAACLAASMKYVPTLP